MVDFELFPASYPEGTGDGVVLLKTEMGAGHGGPSGRYDAIREIALEYGFLLATCGS